MVVIVESQVNVKINFRCIFLKKAKAAISVILKIKFVATKF